MRLAPVALVLACSTPRPASPTRQELPADTVEHVAGRWVAQDNLDWGYTMTIESRGVIDVWIDRGKMGRCEQRGTIEQGPVGRLFRIVYTRGECNPQAVGLPLELTVESFTGTTLTVVVSDQQRTYTRAP